MSTPVEAWDLRPHWDDRKRLSSIWQEHASLPESGLSEDFYDALLEVADWGYRRALLAAFDEPHDY